MEKEWEPVQFEIIPYKDTGTYILRSSEDTGQLLDDHIVMTQSMSFSPYKKPFEERINTWENKLTTTQVGRLSIEHFGLFSSIRNIKNISCTACLYPCVTLWKIPVGLKIPVLEPCFSATLWCSLNILDSPLCLTK